MSTTEETQLEDEIAAEMGDEELEPYDETAETEAEPEPEPEGEPELLAPSPADQQETWDKAAASAQTWRRRVENLFGEDFEALTGCPLCPDNLPGFIIPEALSPELRKQVIDYLQGQDAPEMTQEPGIEACDVCNGWGEALTGSKVPGKQTKLCSKCSGNGWTTNQDRQQWEQNAVLRGQAALAVVPPVTFSPATITLPQTDQWGRPQGSPFYGHDPQYMTPEQKQGDAFYQHG